MAKEIERKFLVSDDISLPSVSKRIKQGYIPRANNVTVRIRTVDDLIAYITIKGPTEGISRDEFEYKIPYEDALEMFSLCSDILVKRRYYLGRWEVDVFEGLNEGLVLAEIELNSEDEAFDLPEWVLDDVTHDKRYSNSNLINNPFTAW
jgi:adenylate cyclase